MLVGWRRSRAWSSRIYPLQSLSSKSSVGHLFQFGCHCLSQLRRGLCLLESSVWTFNSSSSLQCPEGSAHQCDLFTQLATAELPAYLTLPMDSKSPSTILTTNFQVTFSALSSVSQNSAPWSFIPHLLEPSFQWRNSLTGGGSFSRFFQLSRTGHGEPKESSSSLTRWILQFKETTSPWACLQLPFSPASHWRCPTPAPLWQSLGPALTVDGGDPPWVPTQLLHDLKFLPPLFLNQWLFNKWGDSSTSLVFNMIWKCYLTVLLAAFLIAVTTIKSFQRRCWEKVWETR